MADRWANPEDYTHDIVTLRKSNAALRDQLRVVEDRELDNRLYTRERIGRLTTALRDCVTVFKGVRAGIRYVEDNRYMTVSMTAEMASFFNGYSGSPDMDAVEARAGAEMGGSDG